MPTDLNFSSKGPWGTLSKALVRSNKVTAISLRFSRVRHQSWRAVVSASEVEDCGRKPNCRGVRMLLILRCWSVFWWTSLSRSLPIIGWRGIGDWRSPDLKIGITRDSFHALGTLPAEMDKLNRWVRRGETEVDVFLSIMLVIPSTPAAELLSSLRISLMTSTGQQVKWDMEEVTS